MFKEVPMVQFGRRLHRRGGQRALVVGIVVAAALIVGGLVLTALL